MPRITHFEIPADNIERASSFYGTVFGWTFHKWDGPMPYWLVSTGPKDQPGIDGGLMPREHPGQGTINTVQVESLDLTVAAVQQHGGKVVVPKMAIPGVGWFCYCNDTEGNTFGVMQPDPGAK